MGPLAILMMALFGELSQRGATMARQKRAGVARAADEYGPIAAVDVVVASASPDESFIVDVYVQKSAIDDVVVARGAEEPSEGRGGGATAVIPSAMGSGGADVARTTTTTTPSRSADGDKAMMSGQRIVVLGERHTGADVIANCLRTCFDIEVNIICACPCIYSNPLLFCRGAL